MQKKLRFDSTRQEWKVDEHKLSIIGDNFCTQSGDMGGRSTFSIRQFVELYTGN